MAASLADIAQEVGVSVSLVSKVLNNRLGNTGARQEVVEAIREKAVQLNFRKNTSAIALLQGRQYVFGVYLHHHGKSGSGIIERLLQGMSSEARQFHQRQLLDFFTTAKEFLSFRGLMHRGVMDGMIVGGLAHDELIKPLLEAKTEGMPIVTVHKEAIHEAFPNVGIDGVEIGRMATEHLIEQGCRRIAHITDFQDRFEGYRLALAQHKIPFDASLVYDSHSVEFTHDKGRRAAESFLDSNVDMDGLFAQSDEEAAGALNVFCNAGRRVPDDIKVIGVDDSPYCEFSRVPLSSISQNFFERGQVAVQMLMSLIDEREVESVMLKPALRPRASTNGFV